MHNFIFIQDQMKLLLVQFLLILIQWAQADYHQVRVHHRVLLALTHQAVVAQHVHVHWNEL